MTAEVQKSLDEQIDLITQYLHDSMLRLQRGICRDSKFTFYRLGKV
jgi:hypothetical protein